MSAENEARTAVDEQTGITFTLVPESRLATACAIISGTYLVLTMFGLFWLIGDAFSGRNTLLRRFLGLGSDAGLPNTMVNALMCAFIGGALGGIVNELRSFVTWHAERRAFGARFIWKGIVAPWVGGALALFAIAIVQSGVALLGTNQAPSDNTAQPPLAVFAIGALAGYGSREVSKWLDSQVKRAFAVEIATATVPNLLGMPQQEVETALRNVKLRLGTVTDALRPNDATVDIVVDQSPTQGAVVALGSSVNCTISRKPSA